MTPEQEEIVRLTAELAEAKDTLGRLNASTIDVLIKLAASQERERVLREVIQNFRDGNYPHPRTYRYKPWREGETPGYCPHVTVYFEQCENCDAEYWRAALGEP